ncbi:MAG: signal peptidase I [Legionellaceae bacterium]|nr:signal peptidase I [Legionellaceae bacterium]
MNFALILVILSAVTGLGYLLDVLFFAKKRTQAEKPGRILEFCRSFFPVFFIVLLLRSFLVEPFRIPSGSLEPTLTIGDLLAVNKFSYGLRLPVLESKIVPVANPKKGQIAVFRWPPDPAYDFIKRVIGVPGDTVEYRNKVLFINGEEMKQSFIEYTTDDSSGRSVAKYQENLAGVQHEIYINPQVPAYDFKVTVPEGQYFMMGDNRDDSADSRYWGFVADEYLRGKAFLIWMSWNSKVGAVRWSRIGTLIQ